MTMLRKGNNGGWLEIPKVASLGVVIWKTRQHSAFQSPYFRDREHQTVQSPYGVVPFLCGTGGSRSYRPSIRNYQGLEIEASRDGWGKVDLRESHLAL